MYVSYVWEMAQHSPERNKSLREACCCFSHLVLELVSMCVLDGISRKEVQIKILHKNNLLK